MTDLSPSEVLGKALLRASLFLGLDRNQLSLVVGDLGTRSISNEDILCINPNSEQGELAIALIELSNSLRTLCGEDDDWVHHFMNTPNTTTGGVPIDQIMDPSGLLGVLKILKSHGRKT